MTNNSQEYFLSKRHLADEISSRRRPTQVLFSRLELFLGDTQTLEAMIPCYIGGSVKEHYFYLSYFYLQDACKICLRLNSTTS